MAQGESRRVRKAVFPAAGLGTRFLPATKAQPKEMLPIVDTPCIQFAIEEALASGLDDMLVVTGRGKRAIEDHFDRAPELERAVARSGKDDLLDLVRQTADLVDLHFVRQKEPLGLGHAVLQARRHVGDEPFAVILGDDLIWSERPAIGQLLAVYERYGTPVVAVERVARERTGAYGIVAVAPEPLAPGVWEVEGLVEKPDPEQAPSDLAVVGRYVLVPEVFDLLAAQGPGAKGEIQLTDALEALRRRRRLVAVEFEGVRYDTGDKLGYLKANVDFALRRADLGAEFAAFLRERVAALSPTEGVRA
ncbi:MAG: UTP--glucose-1-phosphate uridylyltransferase GalU [Firmicutes bacterium]|nr:UTP--glucose-1-phosphate uridylyltransferase GalU [Bacillota bacterium]